MGLVGFFVVLRVGGVGYGFCCEMGGGGFFNYLSLFKFIYLVGRGLWVSLVFFFRMLFL